MLVKQILIPIGEEWKAALTGTAITLGILVGLIAGVWILSKVKGKNILFSVLAVAGLAVILLGISLIVKDILIPIGQNWKAAAIGTIAVLAIIVGFGAIFTVLGLLIKKFKSLAKYIVAGGLLAVLIGGLGALIGGEIYLFALAASKIYEMNKGGAVLKGSGLIALILTGITTILGILGALSETVGVAAIIGGLVGTIIGALANIISGEVWLICKIAKSVYDMNKGNAVIKGFGVMSSALKEVGKITLLLAGMAVLSVPGTIAAATTAVLIPVMMATNQLVSFYLDIASKLLNVDNKNIIEVGDKIKTLYDAIYKIVDAACPSIGSGIDLAGATLAIPSLKAIFSFINYAAEKMI